MVLEQLAAESLAPTACTTIEEVGSTGVGALTITFLILAVSTIVFIARTGSAKSQKIYYYCNVFVCGFATMSYFAMLSGQGWRAWRSTTLWRNRRRRHCNNSKSSGSWPT